MGCGKCGHVKEAHRSFKKKGRELEECLVYEKGHWCRCDGYEQERARGQVMARVATAYEKQRLR